MFGKGKIKIKWRDGNATYQRGFCIISDDEQYGGFSTCKDFIQDLYANIFNKKLNVRYCSNHTVGKTPSKENIKVAYQHSPTQFFVIDIALDYIHQVEEAFGFSTQSEIGISNRKNTFIATGGKEWLLATPMISLYTFLLRTAQFHHIGENFIKTFKRISKSTSVDRFTAKRLLGVIDKMIELGVKKIFSGRKIKNYPIGLSTHNVGIAGFAYGYGKESCKHWYKGWYTKIDWKKFGF